MNWFYDEKKRALLIQGAFFFFVSLIFFFLFSQLQKNLEKQNIASGFSFLLQNSGFEISEAFIDYTSDHSYLRALMAGAFNTLQISFLGNVLAIFLGFILGVLSFSKNFLLKSLCRAYINFFRNIPLLLQLFFWYALFNEIFPRVQEAIKVLPGVFLSNRGLFIPWSESLTFKIMLISFFLIMIGGHFVNKWALSREETTGKKLPVVFITFISAFLVPLIVFFIGGGHEGLAWSFPELSGFNFEGGLAFSPELTALLLGLVLYTAAFNAEIVRSGIESVDKGQWEASLSLGLKRTQVLSFIIIPQSLRVILPPLTSQILNLTKNSSLAVAIAYPDFVSIANTTLNQTGQAVEVVFLIMLFYLIFNLITSFFMGIYNKKVQLVER